MLPHLKTKQFILNTLHNTFNLPGNTFNQLKLDSLNARPKQDHGVCFDESLQRGGGGGDFFFPFKSRKDFLWITYWWQDNLEHKQVYIHFFKSLRISTKLIKIHIWKSLDSITTKEEKKNLQHCNSISAPVQRGALTAKMVITISGGVWLEESSTGASWPSPIKQATKPHLTKRYPALINIHGEFRWQTTVPGTRHRQGIWTWQNGSRLYTHRSGVLLSGFLFLPGPFG